MGSQWAHSTCLCTPNSPTIFGKTHFCPSFDRFLVSKQPIFKAFCPIFDRLLVSKQPISKAFCGFAGAKMLGKGLKKGSFHFFRHPKRSRIFVGKTHFDPFLTHFLSQNSPFSRHFGTLGGPKQATTSSNRSTRTCFGIPCGPRSFLKQVIFLHRITLADPFWHPPLWATSCSLPRTTGPKYGGVGVG